MSFVKGNKIDDISNDDISNIAYTIRFDGGCAPTNPGPCAGSYVIFDKNGKIVSEGGEFYESGTNNYGEYCGLICGLRKCKELGINNVYIEGDSLLVISQITKKWKVRNVNMMTLLDEVNELLKCFNIVYMRHVLREFNSYADSLCDKILKNKKCIS